ncbi:hypothetical protein KC19_4G243000 [Ceratodon purpureus]|uniref:Secreted protein n=1 Tax=Ceratodon purpureus TaxID=3225 RepID=A0A8T0IEM2_CERPU|nr:hypothetical protein KC19_4G243000 [Ceratodon purpureus]
MTRMFGWSDLLFFLTVERVLAVPCLNPCGDGLGLALQCLNASLVSFTPVSSLPSKVLCSPY